VSRLSRDHRLETRQARTRLKLRHEPYWRQIHHGLFVGYRKGAKGGAWVVRKLQDGRYRKRKLGIADDRQDANDQDVLSYKQAHLKAIAFAQKQTDAEHGLDYTVAQAMRDYLVWHRVNSRNHENTDSVIRANILPRLGRFRLEDLTTAILRRWHTKRAEIDSDDPERRRRRKATANRNLSVLKAALNHAWENGNADNAEIWRRVRPFKGVEAATVRYLTEARCLLGACAPDFQRLVRGALLTGCRYGELTRLVASDFEREAGVITIRLSKAGKVRHVPLNAEGRLFFTRITTGMQREQIVFTKANGIEWRSAEQARPMRRACQVAGIDPPVSFHILRHTYGSFLAKRAVSLQVIAKLLGHSDTRMTEKHYAHLQPDYVAQMVRENLPQLETQEKNVVVLAR